VSAATKGGSSRQLRTSSIRSSQRDKLLTLPMYTALSVPPDSSFSACGISRAPTRVMGLPQLGKEAGAVGGERGAPREGDGVVSTKSAAARWIQFPNKVRTMK